MAGENIGIVVSEFHEDITLKMLEVAKGHIEFLDARVAKVINVPGTYDVPLAAKRLLEDKKIDGVVTIGAVIEGDTDHDIVVINVAAKKLADLSLQYGKPVALGISGPKMTRMEAMERIEGFGKRGAESCIKMIRRLR